MTITPVGKTVLAALICAGLAACSNSSSRPSGAGVSAEDAAPRSSLFDLFENRDDPNVTLEVNKYIWAASLEVLDFMPVQSVDPFSGIIVFGFGTPPGGSRAYRATVLIQDPALDARSLNLSLNSRSGPAAPDTVRAVEDAILTRARQLRARDGRL